MKYKERNETNWTGIIIFVSFFGFLYWVGWGRFFMWLASNGIAG
jgi:hypothetical protein